MATDDGSCMELALEGERLCKTGDCRSGVSYFEAAIQRGTEDLKTLSAIYSQLGNAYFYLQEYEKALEFHKHDLTLARTLGDRNGEAKASGNLGNTLKVLGKFEEAIVCCTRHLDISREMHDKIGEARALYNLGNVYHAKGKHIGRSRHRDPGDFPGEVRLALERAVEFYEANLVLVRELRDKAAEGRAYGNLGNTHYLLGNFDKAVQYHEERLMIAREFNDRAAERRAFSNLGNAHVFLGEFEIAAEYYKRTLEIADNLGDKAIEAQACYSLGNTYTLLKAFEKATQFHLRHLSIAKELGDRVGEGRAYWSLGNAYTALNRHDIALGYAEKHLIVSKEVGDRTGELTAEMNIADLKVVLGISDANTNSIDEELPYQTAAASVRGTENDEHLNNGISQPSGNHQLRALSQGDVKLRVKADQSIDSSLEEGPDEDFFDMLMKAQGGRMEDQRCELPRPDIKKSSNGQGAQAMRNSTSRAANSQKGPKSNSLVPPTEMKPSVSTENLFDILQRVQGNRIDEQRSSIQPLPGLDPALREQLLTESKEKQSTVPDDAFLDMLMRCQATRMEDQRCDFPSMPRGPTVPDEDFFSLILKLQSKRINDQRVHFPDKE